MRRTADTKNAPAGRRAHWCAVDMGIARRDFKSDAGKASQRGVIDAEARDANWVKRRSNYAHLRPLFLCGPILAADTIRTCS